VSTKRAGLLAKAVHWIYGTSWGALYGVVQETFHPRPLANAALLGGVVTATDMTLLPAMKLEEPPWEQEPTSIGAELANHFVYGCAVAGAYSAIDALRSRA
jgi:uncharacterized membrane protein YagU involved in acid resistance